MKLRKTLSWLLSLALLLSAFSATGLATVSAEATYTVSDITAGVNEDKIIAPEDNLLKDATATDNFDRNDPPAVLYDGNLCGVTAGYGWADAYGWAPYGMPLYLTYDLGDTYAVDSFLMAGAGTGAYGLTATSVYIGDKAGSAAVADTPVYTTTDNVVYGRHVALDEPAVGRYVVFVITGKGGTGANAGQVWLSEMAATGEVYVSDEPTTVETPVDSNNYEDEGIYGNDNILKNATASKHETGMSRDMALLVDDVVTGITVPFSGNDSKCLDPISSGSGNVYFSFDLGATYDVSSFFIAGSGTGAYGTEGFAVYDVAYVDVADAEPVYTYGSNVTYGLRVDFGEVITTDVLTVKLIGKNNAGNKQCWISEMGAIGEAAAGTPEENDVVRVVTVGDSITCGVHFPSASSWGTAEFPNKYAQILVDKLNAQEDGNTYKLTNLAISGSAVVGNDDIGTSDSATSWYNQSKAKICHADILTIMLGTNDSGVNWNLRKPLYNGIYKQIVADFRAINPDLELYIITSPYAVKEPYNANLTNDIIPMQKALAQELDATLIDVFHWTKLKMDRDGESSFIDAVDIANGVRVHPGEDGHALMGDIVYAGVSGTGLPDYIKELTPAVLDSIAVTTLPTQLTYVQNSDELDLTGGKLTLTYSDNSTQDVNLTDDMVTGFDNTVLGKQTLTVTYEGKTTTFEVEVIEDESNIVKVVTVGDSITCGVVFPNADNYATAILPGNYPKLVVDKLNAANDGNTYELTNLAISGSAVVGNDVIGTSDSATSWYNQSKSKICYADILTIMLGTNDSGFNWDNLRKPLYNGIYKQIVADFRAINPDLELYIITSPYSMKEPYKTNLTNDVVAMQAALAEELEATLIDVFTWSKLKMERDGEGSFIDQMDITKGIRVHPGVEGHKMMADIVYAGIVGDDLPEYIQELVPSEYEIEALDGTTAAITGYNGTDTDLEIPETVDGYTIVAIDDQAFYNNTSIETVTIPDSVKTLGKYAFSGCTSLVDVYLPESLTTIGEQTFSKTALTEVYLPEKVTTIGTYAFYKCADLVAVDVAESVTFIGGNAFMGCSADLKLTVYTEYAKKYALDNGIAIIDETPQVESIKVTKKPTKLSYVEGSTLSTAGMVVTATYTDDSTKVVTGWKATADLRTAGDKTVTVSFEGKKTTFKVEVVHTYKTTTTKATLKKNGSIVKKCACGAIASKTTIRYAKTVKLSTTSYTYNGKAKKPSVIVKDSAGKTISSKYYSVSYPSGRKNVGTYKVTVKFKGNYSGTKALTFKINPPKTTVKGLTAGKKSLKVSITKKSSQVTGYQVQYSTSKKFTKATTKTVKSYKTTSYTIKSLSAKKTYYVRVRTFKTVKGVKYYSGWSTAKYKKTK